MADLPIIMEIRGCIECPWSDGYNEAHGRGAWRTTCRLTRRSTCGLHGTARTIGTGRDEVVEGCPLLDRPVVLTLGKVRHG